MFQNYPSLAGLKTLLDLHTDGVGWNGSVGALSHVTRHLQLGVVYKSRTTIRSRGAATGNAGIQFAQIGLGAARPDFRYDAEVDNVLPQSAIATLAWQAKPRLRLAAQADWIDWKDAFVDLPISLTHGNNGDINGLLGTDAIRDSIPLRWRNQVTVRAGVERAWLENAVVRAGLSHSNSPVPASTLSPLTAAIGGSTLSAGFGYRLGRIRFDFAYGFSPTAREDVRQSAIKAGEFNDSRVQVGTQSLVFTTSFRL